MAKPLFASALDLAENLGVVDGGDEARIAFRDEIQRVVDAARRVGNHAERHGRLL